MIASKTEDKQMYDQREKALRDYEWAISGALSEGREEGKIAGYEVGKLAGEIQVLQKLLGESVSPDSELFPLSMKSLSEQRNELQLRIRNR
jgi:predicted transposase YdaD